MTDSTNNNICSVGTHFQQNDGSCLVCPVFDKNALDFSDQTREFVGVGTTPLVQFGRTVLVNLHDFSANVSLAHLPPYIEFFSTATVQGEINLTLGADPIVMNPGGLLPLEFQVQFWTIHPGLVKDEIVLKVTAQSNYTGCTLPNATLDLVVQAQEPELNHLGGLLGVGWFMLAVICTCCLGCAVWVAVNRRARVVRVMQPLFLICICLGLFLLGLSILPISLTDENVSLDAADAACMATAWCFILGFTFTFSALFSKLWRINKLIHGSQQCRRLRVTERDVLGPFLVLFSANMIVLVIRTIWAPDYFERIEIDNDPGNTIASCQTSDAGSILTLINFLFVLISFIATCVQAWRARHISDEFSESKNLGIALLIWIQIFVICIPVLFLVGFDSPTTSYFIGISMIFGICMSMLLTLFVPIYLHYRRLKRQGTLHASGPQVHVTGINVTPPETSVSENTATVATTADVSHAMDTNGTTDNVASTNVSNDNAKVEALQETVGQLQTRINVLESQNKELTSLLVPTSHADTQDDRTSRGDGC